MIYSYCYDSESKKTFPLAAEEIPRALQETGKLLWIDLDNPTPDEAQILSSVFGFHHLAIEDCFNPSHHPKIDDFGDYIFIVIHGVDYNLPRDEFATIQLNMFLGKNFLLTFHKDPHRCIRTVRGRVKENGQAFRKGVDFLLHEILDALVDNYYPTIDQLDERVDKIEADVVLNPNPQTLKDIFSLKRDVLYLRRVTSPQREIFNRLSRGEYTLIHPQTQIYFRDI